MSFAVITDAEVVTCWRGVSVRVEVTKTGGRVGSSDSAAVSSENENKNNSKRSKPTFMETSFPAKGELLSRTDRFPGLGFNLLTESSHEPKAHSGFNAAFVAVTVAGQQRNSHR
jgi:hypothetical protein